MGGADDRAVTAEVDGEAVEMRELGFCKGSQNGSWDELWLEQYLCIQWWNSKLTTANLNQPASTG